MIRQCVCHVACTVVLFAACVDALSQPDHGMGGYVGFQYGLYPSNITGLPGAQTCCTDFGQGSSADVYGGLLYRFDLASSMKLDLRVGLSTNGASFSKREEIGNALEGTGDDVRVVRAISQYSLTTSRVIADVTPLIHWYAGRAFNMMIGPYLGYVLSGTFSTTEELAQPTSATFAETGSRTRNNSKGNITSLNALQLGAMVGVAYDIDLPSVNMSISPELVFLMPFTPPVNLPDGQTWSQLLFRAGLSLRARQIPPPALISLPDPVSTEPLPNLALSVQARAEKNGVYTDVARVVVTETLSKEMYPLLPYVFFEEGSHLVPPRYRRLSEALVRRYDPSIRYKYDSTSDKRSNTIKVYHDLLNVIAKRLRDTPGSSITLTGYHADVPVENRDANLSRKRAESIRDYLLEAWKIDPAQVKFGTHGGLPPKAAKTNVADALDVSDGHAENRRVEITSDPPSILYPVVIEDTTRSIDRPNIEYVFTVQSPVPIATWELEASNAASAGSEMPLVDTSGTEIPDKVVRQYDADVDQRAIPKRRGVITYSLTIVDAEARTASAANTLDVAYVTIQDRRKRGDANIEVNTYRLIMFDYESSDLSELPESILQSFDMDGITVLQDAATSDSTIVRGFADRKGNDRINEQLAERRATSVADRIRTANGFRSVITSSGTTERDAPYPNTLPEQRLYNRTVEIVTKKGSK